MISPLHACSNLACHLSLGVKEKKRHHQSNCREWGNGIPNESVTIRKARHVCRLGHLKDLAYHAWNALQGVSCPEATIVRKVSTWSVGNPAAATALPSFGYNVSVTFELKIWPKITIPMLPPRARTDAPSVKAVAMYLFGVQRLMTTVIMAACAPTRHPSRAVGKNQAANMVWGSMTAINPLPLNKRTKDPTTRLLASLVMPIMIPPPNPPTIDIELKGMLYTPAMMASVVRRAAISCGRYA